MRFSSYRVLAFPVGSTIQVTMAASRQQGLVCLKSQRVQIRFSTTKSPNKFADVVVWNFAVDLRGAIMMRDPFTAGLLSFLIPGVGQLYNGRILAGILWLIITPGFWVGTGGTLGWICHIIAAYTAYSYAKDHRVRHAY